MFPEAWAASKHVAATEDTAHPVQTASTRPVHPRSGADSLVGNTRKQAGFMKFRSHPCGAQA